MQTINCYIPLKLRFRGEPSEDDWNALEESLVAHYTNVLKRSVTELTKSQFIRAEVQEDVREPFAPERVEDDSYVLTSYDNGKKTHITFASSYEAYQSKISSRRLFYISTAHQIRNVDDKTLEAISYKLVEYSRLAGKLKSYKDRSLESIDIPKEGISYLIRANDAIQRALNLIARELGKWADRHMFDKEFLIHDARWGLGEMLAERRDLIAVLRAAELEPVEKDKFEGPINRPLYVTVTETLISFIPIIGNAIALYESYSARDLFGYKLDTVDRAVLAGTVLLPFVGRFIKGGRALYRAERMARLYGRDAAEWSRVFAVGERLATHPNGVKLLGESERVVRSGRHVADDPALEKELENLLKDINSAEKSIVSGVKTAAKDIAQASTLSEKFEKLITKYPILKALPLDVPAIDRILAKGPNLDHTKGQLLEELLSNKVAELFGTDAGKALLGVAGIEGRLEFIPGYLIRDAAKRQWSDGVLAVRLHSNALYILTIFEAKAGPRAARELSLASSSISDLSKAERQELRAAARDFLREMEEEARRTGQKITKSIEDIEKEIKLSELGGQVRSDIERAAPSEGKTSTKFIIDGVETDVVVSPRGTTVVGVLPEDVKGKNLLKSARALSYAAAVLNITIKVDELERLAKDLLSITAVTK